jgi:hypothetical protein
MAMDLIWFFCFTGFLMTVWWVIESEENGDDNE